MVNIVLVSHSKKLAEGVAEMVTQMTASEEVKVAIAAGAGDENEDLGTNAMEIVDAIQSVYSEEGVLILMDLGSAVLSAEVALDFLPDDVKDNLRICPAPFVEGAITAAVQAGLGSDLTTVYDDAMQSLKLKTEQLSGMVESLTEQDQTEEPIRNGETDQREINLIIPNKQGLHARPAVLFVKTIGEFEADVMVTNLANNKGPVQANSLISVMTLAAQQGHELHIRATGEEKNEVIEALKALFERNLEDEP